jgi:hypothetical protein
LVGRNGDAQRETVPKDLFVLGDTGHGDLVAVRGGRLAPIRDSESRLPESFVESPSFEATLQPELNGFPQAALRVLLGAPLRVDVQRRTSGAPAAARELPQKTAEPDRDLYGVGQVVSLL